MGDSTKCQFAELMFLEAENDFPLEGTFICSEDVTNPAILDNIEKGVDGDWVTNLSLPIEGWVGIDFGNPIVVEKVVCVPRSDDNSIHLKELYEL